jgi:hypothetical protein
MVGWATLTSLDASSYPPPLGVVAFKRGGLEGSPPAAFVFGKVGLTR